MIPESIKTTIQSFLSSSGLDPDLSKVYFVGSRAYGYYRETDSYRFIYEDTTSEGADDNLHINTIDTTTSHSIDIVRRNPSNLFELSFDLPAYNVSSSLLHHGTKEGILDYFQTTYTNLSSSGIDTSLFTANKSLYSSSFNITQTEIDNIFNP